MAKDVLNSSCPLKRSDESVMSFVLCHWILSTQMAEFTSCSEVAMAGYQMERDKVPPDRSAALKSSVIVQGCLFIQTMNFGLCSSPWQSRLTLCHVVCLCSLSPDEPGQWQTVEQYCRRDFSKRCWYQVGRRGHA